LLRAALDAAVLLAAALLCGCGQATGRAVVPPASGTAGETPAPGTGGVTPPSGEPSVPATEDSGPLPIPSPAQVYAQLHGAKQASSLLTRDASDFVPTFSHRVTTIEPDAIFSPNWENGYSPFETIAWAIYRFDLTARTGRLAINTQWPQPPKDYKLLWLGASDWQKNRWQWYNGAPSGVAQTAVGAIDTFKHPGTGEMYVAVVLLGQTSALLRKVWLTCSLRGDWWMAGRNATHHACSPFKGPDYPTVKWQVSHPPYINGSADIVYDANGVLYFSISYVGMPATLYALNPDGSERWEQELDAPYNAYCPAIGDDGTIYVAQESGALYAFNQAGIEKWRFAGRNNMSFAALVEPAIGSDGTIYVTGPKEDTTNDTYLYAVNPDGTLRWEHYFDGYDASAAAVGNDGTLYCGSADGRLYAFDPAGVVKWTYDTGQLWNPRTPAVGGNGLVYYSNSTQKVYAVGTDGVLAWTYELPDVIYVPLAVGPDGSVYVPCQDNHLYALSGEGTLLWSYYIAAGFGSVSIDASGTVYAGSGDGRLYAPNPDGSLKWWFTAPQGIASTPTIGEDGTLYVSCVNGDLYAIGPGSQMEEYSASGYVKDAGGVGIPGVTMTITGEEPVVTDAQGFWSKSGLPMGDYIVSPSKDGYKFEPALAILSVAASDVDVAAFTGSPLNEGGWPMWGMNSRHTRRSPHAGPAQPDVLWSTWLGMGEGIVGEPCIDGDGVVYFQGGSYGLHAFNPDGTERWSNTYFPGTGLSPAVGLDGTVYTALRGASELFIAFAPSGEYKWSFGGIPTGQITFQPDGAILLNCMSGDLVTIGLDGALRGAIEGYVDDMAGPPVIADGTIYAYRFRNDEVLACALNPDGSEQWARPVEPPGSGEKALSAAVGDDGTVYFGSQSRIYAFSPAGTQKWVYQVTGNHCLPLAIGADGAVYASVEGINITDNNKLLVLNADGSFRWDYFFGGYPVTTSPTLDSNGTVYVCKGGLGDLYALNPDGSLKWVFNASTWLSGVAIGPDGTLYFGDESGRVYALGPGEG
jgi:outer membrane protein assembly factor BamB